MRVLNYDDLKAKGVPYSKPHLWRLVKAGKFPAPIKWGAARNGWIEEEIDQLIAERIAERDRDSEAT
jgi:prophage regulatory protein